MDGGENESWAVEVASILRLCKGIDVEGKRELPGVSSMHGGQSLRWVVL